jgi:hypothetical protein
MASLLLSFAGQSLGAAFGPVGAVAGRALGSLAGGVVDRALFGDASRRHIEGPRLNDLDVMGSTEGAPIPRLYGRARLSGQVIWATKLEEVISTRSESAGGGKGGARNTVTSTYCKVSTGLRSSRRNRPAWRSPSWASRARSCTFAPRRPWVRRTDAMNWFSLLSALVKFASSLTGWLRERALISAGDAKGRAAVDADHAAAAAEQGARMREIAARLPARNQTDKRIEEGSA